MSLPSADYYAQYGEAVRTHWWFRGRERVVESVVKSLMQASRGATIVDVGSGPGGPTKAVFPEGRVVAMDMSPLPLRAYAGAAALVVGDGTRVPYRPKSVEIVCAFDVLEHLRDDQRALTEWRDSLVPGGWLVLTVPAYRWLWSDHDEANGHYRRYRVRALRRLLSMTGFVTMRITYFNLLLLPGIALARWSNRVLKSQRGSLAPTPEAGLDLHRRFPAWLEACFEAALRLEASWLRYGVLPAGVSICAVARVPQ